MADHASLLLGAVQALLTARLPLAGGWHAGRLETPTYPVGYIDLTQSTPLRGQGYYGEDHRGVISIWTRADQGEPVSPLPAFRLCNDAHTILGQEAPKPVGLTVSRFTCGAMTPQNPDGLTWGRSFIFTATTHEVNSNG